MSVTSETDEEVMAGNGKDALATDDANGGENDWGNGRLKKGPWTSNEDGILIAYVVKHGEGNWNAVQKHTGLARCGKSCRLRWANHLRPDLKKGQFSKEEENLIIELHAKLGNKWARMAAELPGRTDNEIKNYWNTRIKRRQRAGLPIYPPDMCLETLNENQQKDDTTAFPSGDLHYQDFIPIQDFDPAPNFRNLDLNPSVYPQAFLDIPLNLHSYQCKSLLSTDHPSKRLRVSESLYPGGLNTTLSNAIPGGNQYHNECFVQNDQSLIYSSASSSGAAILNGNPSSSSPDWASKLELPSLQTPVDNWTSPSDLLPSLESVDALIQTPPTEHALSCHFSPKYSGLLDTVPHESQIMQISRNTSHQESSHVMNTSSQGNPGFRWDHQYGELSTILDHSSFCDGTPMSGHSFDEPGSFDAMAELIGEDEESETWCTMQYEDKFKKGPMQYKDDFEKQMEDELKKIHTNNN